MPPPEAFMRNWCTQMKYILGQKKDTNYAVGALGKPVEQNLGPNLLICSSLLQRALLADIEDLIM